MSVGALESVQREYKLAEVRRRTGKSYPSLHKIFDELQITPRQSVKDARALTITQDELDKLLSYLAREHEQATETMALSRDMGGQDSNRLLAQALTIVLTREAQHEQFAKDQVAKADAVLQELKSFQDNLREQLAEVVPLATTEAMHQELKSLQTQVATAEAAYREEIRGLREQLTELARTLAVNAVQK